MIFSHSIGLFKIFTLWNKSNWQQHVCYLNIPSWFLIIVPLASHSNLHRKMDLCVCPSISPTNSQDYLHCNCRNQWWKGKAFTHDDRVLRGIETRRSIKREITYRLVLHVGRAENIGWVDNESRVTSFNKWRHLRLSQDFKNMRFTSNQTKSTSIMSTMALTSYLAV